MRPKNRYEKIIANLHIRLIESKNGIRTMHTEIIGEIEDFSEIGNILIDNKENSSITILLIQTLAKYIEENTKK